MQTEKPGWDTWRKLKGTAKLQYIWDYYKIPMFLIFVALYVAGYLIWRSATAENPQLYLAYVNLEVGETLDHNLTEGFLDYLQPAERIYGAVPGYRVYLGSKSSRQDLQIGY